VAECKTEQSAAERAGTFSVRLKISPNSSASKVLRACLNFAFGSENCQFLVLTSQNIAE
jgi:hypothetical protein